MKVILLSICLFLFSCKRNNSYYYIDHDTDSTFYKIDICDSNDYLQSPEEDWKETVLLTNSIYVKDSCFGGLGNMSAAIKYAKSINVEKPYDCITRTAISIKGTRGKFQETWIIDRNFYWPDEEFGEYAGKIEVDEGHYKIDGKNYKGIKIIEKINEDGLSLRILNYIYQNDSWMLLSREHINTTTSEKNYVYCKDSLNRNVQQQDNLPIFINNQMMYDLTDPQCR